MPDDLALLTVADVAGILKRSRGTVLELIRDGKLPVVRLDDGPLDHHRRGRKDYRVSRLDLEAFIQARTVRLAGPPVPTGGIRTGRKASVSRPTPVPLAGLWDGVDRIRGRKTAK